MRRSLATLLVVMLCLLSLTGRAQQSGPLDPAKQVQHEVEVLIRSFYRGDAEPVFRASHARVLEMMGGAEKARAALAEAVSQLTRSGMKIESFSFPRPPEFFAAGDRRFVFVPTLTVIATDRVRVESLNFQLGILEPGTSDWKFVEGSRLTPENIQVLFPDFPRDRPFPRFYRKKL